MPRALDDLIEAFSSLPGIGRKSAARLAFFLLKRPVEDSRDIAQRMVKARESLKPCKICGNLADNVKCDICEDNSRDGSLICVVEEPSDVTAIESTGEYRGLYHVLGGALSPLDGIGPDDLNITALKKRIGDKPSEIILATNPTTEGEATASYLLSILSGKNVRITRIARGLPAGGSLEYADKNTLARALENRTKLDK
ncbi:MAG: recombination protein RecR [Candidatus Zixiibacteriota bacterium]|nr:MAG: recombination protein RecR [candidate division Zixibacteria bacterium]